MRVGLIPMSCKPYHAGHHKLIELATSECDAVTVYTSASDREAVSGQAMKEIWEVHIIPTLPKNVEVKFVGNPVKSVYEALGTYEVENPLREESFFVYSDPRDLDDNFPTSAMCKYFPTLRSEGKLKGRPVQRSSTVEVSGTEMRRWLSEGDEQSFCDHLPDGLDKKRVWEKLRSAALARTSSTRVWR